MRILIVWFLLCPFIGFSQELVSGDSSIVTVIQPKLAAIYDSKDTTLFFLTKNAFIDQKVFASNIVCYVKDNKPNRIIVNYTVNDGILSKEFWLSEGQLIFCYLTMEYFDESANKTAWKNFKHINAFESRYYFDSEKIVYEKQTGLSTIMTTKINKQLNKEKDKLLNYIERRYSWLSALKK